MIAFIAVLALMVSASQAQYTLGSYGYYYVSQFFTLNEIQKIENVIAQQACSGATVEQIFDNALNTITQNIGANTAWRALTLANKLQHDLGNEFSAVQSAVRTSAQNTLTPVLNDLVRYCGYGADTVVSQGSAYANTQFVQSMFNQLYQAVAGVSGHAWTVTRNDLNDVVYFSSYGY
uniref:SCP domain-containing protein n=1 Tax=Steinernema glaseri TaxID=37863 RepID=A0A1I8AJB6_9BILA